MLTASAGGEAVEAKPSAGAVAVVDDEYGRPIHCSSNRSGHDRPADLRRRRTALFERLAAGRPRGVVGRLRLAVLAVGSDRPQPVPDVVAAAAEALRLGDLELSERLGQAVLGREPDLARG